MRQTAKIALAHLTCILSLARARESLGDWTRTTARKWQPQGSLPTGPCGVGEAYSTPWPAGPADGALSRPDVAEGALSGARVAGRPEKRDSGPDSPDAGASDPRPGAAIQWAGRRWGVWPAADGVWKGPRPHRRAQVSAIPWYGAKRRALGAGRTPGSRTPGRPCANLRKVAGGAPAGVEPKDKPSRPAGVVRGRGRHRAATVCRTPGSGSPLNVLYPPRARAREASTRGRQPPAR